MGEIIFINWDIHTLFGWENEKSDLVIDAIIRGIEAGDNFPPVPVHKKGDSVFYCAGGEHLGLIPRPLGRIS